MSETLTDSDRLAEIEREMARLREGTPADSPRDARGFGPWPLSQPPLPAPGTWQREALDRQAAKAAERVATARAEQERLHAEREAEQERRARERAERERLRCARAERAIVELDELAPAIREAEAAYEHLDAERATLDGRFGALLERVNGLREVAAAAGGDVPPATRPGLRERISSLGRRG